MSEKYRILIIAICLIVLGTVLVGMWTHMAYPGDSARLDNAIIGSIIGFSISIIVGYLTVNLAFDWRVEENE